MDKKQVTTVSVAGLGSAVALFALMDTRYAIATDVELIIQAIQGDRVERMEMVIKDAEERALYLNSIPQEKLSDYQRQDLLRQTHKKEAAVRKLDRINGEK